MRSLTLVGHVPGGVAADAYRLLTDFASYPEHSAAVRSVTVSPMSEGTSVSQWEVAFRNGILRWTEEDTFDDGERTIQFRQLSGDVAVFDGSWRCADSPGGCDVTFSARLDLGIPTLADVLEPIAVRALVDNTESILRGLFGARIETVAA
jgi:ribosome-associated toxin RatA of RatAB toxin-antitoxin module